MNVDLILYLAVSVVAVLALAGTAVAIACSVFLDSLPKPPRSNASHPKGRGARR